ncbi:hypothetical protein V2A60_004457 [Cordyceps javanica]
MASFLSTFARKLLEPLAPQVTPTEKDINKLLGSLCVFPAEFSAKDHRISEHKIQQIRIHLQSLDRLAGRSGRAVWCYRPRIYAILRTLGKVSLMDEFIREDLNDFFLPWNERTLPRSFFSGENEADLRTAFLKVQEFYLTDSSVKDVEAGKSHQNLSLDGDKFFIPCRHLGQGGFGGVDEVFSSLSQKRYARKRVSRGRHNEHDNRSLKMQEALVKELEVLKVLSRQQCHRHLVKIIGSYTDRHYIAYLMEPVAENNLEQLLESNRMTDQLRSSLCHFYGCLAGAIRHLHRNQLRHRDLTARNILIYRNEVYVSDFGSAYNWAEHSRAETRHLNPPVTQEYMAPEIDRRETRGEPSDMWSLGVIYLKMTTRLLGRSLADLKAHVEQHARRNKHSRYFYANIPAVREWLQKLSHNDTQTDNEPISWTYDLMSPQPDDRPRAFELMRDILESPSFNRFCCFKCYPDFQAETFMYDGPSHTEGTVAGAAETMDTVERLFSPVIDQDTHEIDEWLQSVLDQVDRPKIVSEHREPPVLYDPSGEASREMEPVKAEYPVPEAAAEDLYEPNLLCSWPIFQYQAPSVSFNSTQELDTAEIPTPATKTSIDWNDQELVSPPATPVLNQEAIRYRNLCDSQLGFEEYDDESSRLYDEFSDRSDESGSAFYTARQDPSKPLEDLLNTTKWAFEEESDKSETVFGQDAEQEAAILKLTTSQGPPEPKTLIRESKYVAVSDSPRASKVLEGNQEESEVDKKKQDNTSRINFGENNVSEKQRKNKSKGIKSVPTESVFKEPEVSSTKRISSQDLSNGMLKSETSVKRSNPKKKLAFQINVEENNIQEGQTVLESADDAAADAYPPPAGAPQRPQKLSRANIRVLGEMDRQVKPRSFKKREPPVRPDVERLMQDFHKKASASDRATTVMSEGTKRLNRQLALKTLPPNYMEGLLVGACKEGKSAQVRHLLTMIPAKRGREAWRRFDALMQAIKGASQRHNKCVRNLIEAEAVNVNQCSRATGKGPLHAALGLPGFKGYGALVLLLLEGRADPNLPDRNGDYPITILFSGAESAPLEPHRLEALALLLRADALPDTRLPGSKSTPLHLAVRRQDKLAVSMLLHRGADVDAQNSAGMTALLLWANQLRAGAAPPIVVLDLLLAHGARVDARDPARGRTALHQAVRASRAEAVDLLLRHRADAARRDAHGNDALALAVQHAGGGLARPDGPQRRARQDVVAEHAEIMALLGEAGGYDWPARPGECAVQTAIREDNAGLLKQLLSRQLDPAASFPEGSIRAYAMKHGSLEVRGLLGAS